jgi:hypothetical protein
MLFDRTIEVLDEIFLEELFPQYLAALNGTSRQQLLT